jgi:predicted RNA-binding Zn-ribbon protein involved in translation (DUF1610 family)
MEFDNIDEIEPRYKKNRTHKCEDCGYVWVEELPVEADSHFNLDREYQYFCPMCGGSYLDQM